jgi:MFS transporter, PPP family, 3-phenylpropionic acid transporter
MPSHPQLSTDHFALKLGLFYAAYFLFGGIQLPFFPLWLEARGLDAPAIGLVIAAPMIVRIVAVPIITHQADRHRALKTSLVVTSVVATLAMTGVGLVEGFAAILLTFAVAAAAFSPVLALADAYALNGLGARGQAYGPVRLWGSVAFIAGSVSAGVLLGWVAAGHLIWLIVAALVASVGAAIALEPLSAERTRPREPLRSPRALWRSPAFLAVAAAASLTQSSHALYYGFSALEWRAAGLDGTAIGLLWGLGVLAEIVLFALSPRLPPAMDSTALLAIGAGGAVVRWIAMALDPPAAALPALQCLHALSFGATHLGAVAFFARAAPAGIAATAQGTLAVVLGLLMAGAMGLAGLLYARWGALAYAAMALTAVAGGLLALCAHRMARPQ